MASPAVPPDPAQPTTKPIHNTFLSPYRYHSAILMSSPYAISSRTLWKGDEWRGVVLCLAQTQLTVLAGL